MTKLLLAAGAAALAGSSAMADVTLQIDINAVQIGVKDGSGAASGFNGLAHTGSIDFAISAFSEINEIGIKVNNGAFVDAGFAGNLTDFSGSITLSNGVVTGGSMNIEVDGSDTYTALVAANSGLVQTAATPGGFVIDGLTWNGKFSDAMFGNVDVSDWYAVQDLGSNLNGSFLHFNFSPDAQTGVGYGDVDAFVVVPLPPAGLAGAGLLAGIAGFGYIRRRRA